MRIDAPSGTEVSVMRQKARTIVHILHYSPERRAKDLDLVEDIVPLHDLALSVKLSRAPKRVYVAPNQNEVEFSYEGGRGNARIPEVRGHAMVVFE